MSNIEFTKKDAAFSLCGRYRYLLLRMWGEGKPINLLLLNPSTATAEIDDPTVRRCIRFAHDWGYPGLIVTNIFALRGTDPECLYKSPDPIGAENDSAIIKVSRSCDEVVCAWGNHGRLNHRGYDVIQMLRDDGIEPLCLGVTFAGEPKHPLYLPASTERQVFKGH